MARFVPKRFEQIFAGMIARVVARSGLTDVADTSVTKHILAAAARSDDQIYFQMSNLQDLFDLDKASGDDLDLRAGEIQPGVVTRIAAAPAVGQVQFSRSTAATSNITIAVGTKVRTGDGDVFTTTTVGTIATGQTLSNLVSATADVPGSAGNVAAATIVRFVNKPTNVDEVTNPSPFQFGRDRESDDSFRQRIRDFIAGLARCTPRAIEVALLGQQDETTGATILFSSVVEDPVNRGDVTVFIDDGTGAAAQTLTVLNENVTEGLIGPPPDSAVGGEERLFLDNRPINIDAGLTLTSSIRGALTQDAQYVVNPATGQINFTPALVAGEQIFATYEYFTGLVALAQKIVDGDASDRENFPGLRAAGVLVRVLTPQVLLQNVVAILAVDENFEDSVVQANVAAAVQDYINTLDIGNDVVRNQLIRFIMAVPGVLNVDLQQPATDITILDDQLARTTASNITIT